jgi:hypothetical protein
MPFGIAKEEKLTITAYSTAKRSLPALNTIKVLMNPQTFTTRHENKFAQYRAINSSKSTASYAYSLAEEMALTLLLVDSRVQDYGVLALMANKSVSQQLKEFMSACYLMNGNIHEPNFLNIKWGDINFDCKLKTLDVKYTSFDKDGKPRRAELEVVFVEDLPKEKIAKVEGKSSPDLTHIVTVKAGDTLPLLTERIYGVSDTSLYIEVARVNQMNDFRNLQQGQRIFFPPLENQ